VDKLLSFLRSDSSSSFLASSNTSVYDCELSKTDSCTYRKTRVSGLEKTASWYRSFCNLLIKRTSTAREFCVCQRLHFGSGFISALSIVSRSCIGAGKVFGGPIDSRSFRPFGSVSTSQTISTISQRTWTDVLQLFGSKAEASHKKNPNPQIHHQLLGHARSTELYSFDSTPPPGLWGG